MLATLVAAIIFHRTVALPAEQLAPLLSSLGVSTIVVLVVANLVILGQDLLMFAAIAPDGQLYLTSAFLGEPRPAYGLLLVPQAWSLGVELLFYLLAPFLLRGRTSLIVLVAVVSVALRIVLMSSGYSNDPWSYRLFPTELAVFLCGALAYRAFRANLGVASKRVALTTLVCMIGVFLAYSQVGSGVPEPAKRFTVVVMLALALPSLFTLTRDWAIDTFIGKLSYPIYVSHLLLLGFVRNTGAWRAPLLIIISLAAALLIVRFIEDPIDRWRTKLRAS
jgi:peptidoglycan/LPS O-acetylase OafA/YrhL